MNQIMGDREMWIYSAGFERERGVFGLTLPKTQSAGSRLLDWSYCTRLSRIVFKIVGW